MGFRPNIRLLQQFSGLVESAPCIVPGLDRQPVFVNGAVALAGEVKNLAHLNVAPDFGPAWNPVAPQRGSTGVHARLVAALAKKQLGDVVAGQRTLSSLWIKWP